MGTALFIGTPKCENKLSSNCIIDDIKITCYNDDLGLSSIYFCFFNDFFSNVLTFHEYS